MGGPWRFVAQLLGASSGEDWLARCRRVEAQGYAGISLPDHFGAQFAPLVALAAAATATERCTLGTNVLANDFRHPAMLAKELATLDVISRGRVVAGIGAGWMTKDYESTAIPLDRPRLRIDRLLETVAVLRGLWDDPTFSFAGQHHHIDELDGHPKPFRTSGIPILIGGGSRRILTEAGRHADIVGIGLDNRAGVQGESAWRSATAAAVREKLAWVRAGAEGRPEQPAISVRVLHVAVTDDRRSAAVDFARSVGLDADDVLGSPHALVGTPGEIVDDLRRRRDEYGIAEYVVSERSLDDLSLVIERLAGSDT